MSEPEASGQARQLDDAAAAQSGEPGRRAGGQAAAGQRGQNAGLEAQRKNPSSAGRAALCVARFYEQLADALESGARAALDEAEVADVDRFVVAGAFELPLAAKYAAESGRYDAIVCLGAVIRGETDHYEYVCREAARGIQQVQLETGVPCGFGVLTVDTMAQALDRVGAGSKRDTGRHAAEAALSALEVKRQLLGRRKSAGFAV